MHQMILENCPYTHPQMGVTKIHSPRELRFIANAAGGLIPSLASDLQSCFGKGCCILPGYGMTEAMPISSPPLGYKLDRPGSSGVRESSAQLSLPRPPPTILHPLSAPLLSPPLLFAPLLCAQNLPCPSSAPPLPLLCPSPAPPLPPQLPPPPPLFRSVVVQLWRSLTPRRVSLWQYRSIVESTSKVNSDSQIGMFNLNSVTVPVNRGEHFEGKQYSEWGSEWGSEWYSEWGSGWYSWR